MILGIYLQTPFDCFAGGQVNHNTNIIPDSADHQVDEGEGLAVVYDN